MRSHAASWEAACAPFFDPEFAASAIQDRRTRWHTRIAEGQGILLVAAVDGRPLALSHSVPSTTRPGHGEVLSFYGHPDGWGTGVAAALMNETLHHLRDNGFAQVHLWTLRDTHQSRRFAQIIQCSESLVRAASPAARSGGAAKDAMGTFRRSPMSRGAPSRR